MERFLGAYKRYLMREYGRTRGLAYSGIYPLLCTEVSACEVYDSDSEDVIGFIQVSIDANEPSYIVELHPYEGKVYRVVVVFTSLDELADDLDESDFSSVFTWALTQIDSALEKEV